jgi:hypothetical protein
MGKDTSDIHVVYKEMLDIIKAKRIESNESTLHYTEVRPIPHPKPKPSNYGTELSYEKAVLWVIGSLCFILGVLILSGEGKNTEGVYYFVGLLWGISAVALVNFIVSMVTKRYSKCVVCDISKYISNMFKRDLCKACAKRYLIDSEEGYERLIEIRKRVGLEVSKSFEKEK